MSNNKLRGLERNTRKYQDTTVFLFALGLVMTVVLMEPFSILYAQDVELQTDELDKLPSSGIMPFDIAIILLTGGAVTTWLTLLFDNLQKNRSLLLDINKHKIEILSTMIPTFARIASSSGNLSTEFRKSEPDPTLCLYLLCQLFLANQEALIKAGGIQLTSNVGEKVVVSLISDVYIYFLEIGLESIHYMRGLVKKETSFYVFKNEIIIYNMPFYYKFLNFINDLDDERRKELQLKCQWLYQVLNFEMNQLYQHWYTGERVTIPIDDQFINYLRGSEERKPFIDRLNRLNITRKQKIVRLLQLEHFNPYSKEI